MKHLQHIKKAALQAETDRAKVVAALMLALKTKDTKTKDRQIERALDLLR